MSDNSTPNKRAELSTDSYKGVRDFFPSDMAVQNHIFSLWKNISRKYGYEEYNASVLEPAELYRAKSGDELVNEQTYTFTDRGDREVTLRPEMTPTVARMVAARRRELTFPLRWFSIPNFFRYEQPQRGRLREFWQLNVDIFGVASYHADVEVISIACDITKAYGLKDSDFEVRINNRKIMNYILKDVFKLDDVQAKQVSRLIDRKSKVSGDVFKEGAEVIFGEKTQEFLTLVNSNNFEEFTSRLPQTKEEHEGLREIRQVIEGLEKLGISNARFDQTLMRGLDYYTGIVFEVFDKNPANRRAVLGGGRYDDLLSLFGNDKISAVGFAAGDVVAQNLIETYGKLPTNVAPADLYICSMNESHISYAEELAQRLREQGVKVSLDYSGKKIGDQIKAADKMHIPFVICIGDEEITSGMMPVKNLKTGKEEKAGEPDIADLILGELRNI